MGKINILDSTIYNRIAAGEVVERPRSVVKELVENSLDAGAQSITIEIEGGGIDRIRVTDDGGGIEKSDIPKVFLPHATSKISTARDLDSIKTLGFRGEALSSIASVARVKLVSRVRGSEFSEVLEIDNGEVTSSGEGGGGFGTVITVERLFDKIPARKKFLSSAKAEEAEISSLIARLILSNYDISFKYIADGKLIYQSFGKGLSDAVSAVYGMDALNNLFEVDLDLGDVKVYGLVSRPGYSKYNRSYQTLIVGGRYVVDTDISFTVYNCFKDYLMTRQFPMYVLFVDTPPDMVDVNIHPNKMQVRFAQLKRVLAAVKQAISEALYGLSSVVGEVNLSKNLLDNPESIKEVCATNVSQPEKVTSDILFTNDAEKTSVESNINAGFNGFGGGAFTLKEQPFRSVLNKIPDSGRYGDFGQKQTINFPDLAKYGDDKNLENEPNLQQTPLKTSFLLSGEAGDNEKHTVVGKLFDTYILLESGNNLFIIDQHAAHERLLFDKLYADAQNARVAVQSLLIPYEFSLSHSDAGLVCESEKELMACGFILKKVDELRFELQGVPLISTGFNAGEFAARLSEMLNSGDLSAARSVREKIIQAACKAAIKGGDALSALEIDTLLKRMSESGSVYCPHGRPVVVKISRAELEKWFKRRL